jgi:glycosyltransferase involved in cell wall biosynthesis
MSQTVSVVLTSYNQRQYLAEALDSVVAQTTKPLEVLVADDASTDGSPELIRSYEALYPGWVKGLFGSTNLGIPRNRTAGLRRASGDYVAILDGDDRLLPGNLAAQLAVLESAPDAGCAYTNVYFVDASGTRTGVRDQAARPSGDVFAHVAAGAMGLLRSMLMRRDLVAEAGFLDERFPRHDGFVLTARLAQACRFQYVAEPLAEYRVHAGGDSRGISPRERAERLAAVWDEVRLLAASRPRRVCRAIDAAWRARLAEWRLRADLLEGRRARALGQLLAAGVRHPASLRQGLRLLMSRDG